MNEAATPHRSLSRSLLARHLSMIAIGGVIGAGLFVGSGAAIAAAGPASVISYGLTGLVVMLVMRMLSEMIVAMPEVRSFTEFSRAALGNWAGFTVGWLYWYFWIIVVPIEAIAGATLLHTWIPLANWQIGVALMVVMTLVNLMPARVYGEFEFWFASIKVIAIIAFIVIALLYASGTTSSASSFSNLTVNGGFAPRGYVAVIAAVTTVIFSMVGSEAVAIAAGESKEPAQIVARLSTTLVLRIAIFYVGSILMIVAVVPWDTIKPGESPFKLALEVMHIPAAAMIMSVIILTAVLSCLNSAFYIASRVLFALGEKGDAPDWLTRTTRRGVPIRSVLLGSAAGFAGVVVAKVSPGVVFAFLVNASGALIIFVYLAIAVSHIRLRKARDGGALQISMWFFPWLTYLTVAAMISVLVAMALTPDLASQLWISVLALAIALGAYLVHRKRRSRV